VGVGVSAEDRRFDERLGIETHDAVNEAAQRRRDRDACLRSDKPRAAGLEASEIGLKQTLSVGCAHRGLRQQAGGIDLRPAPAVGSQVAEHPRPSGGGRAEPPGERRDRLVLPIERRARSGNGVRERRQTGVVGLQREHELELLSGGHRADPGGTGLRAGGERRRHASRHARRSGGADRKSSPSTPAHGHQPLCG
jgi:hypothetical protein